MKTHHCQKGTFQKVGECLYRYSTSGTYYAVIRYQGKLIRKALDAADQAMAKRELRALKRDLSKLDLKAGRLTLAQLANQYLETVQHLSAKTVEAKSTVIKRLKNEWPGAEQQQVKDVRPSYVMTFLSKQGKKMGKSSYNQYVSTIREMFTLAVSDRIIAASPAVEIRYLKRDQPIRDTPTLEQFQAIVEDIRKQKFNPGAQASADYVEFLGLAGIGNAEASGLSWKDIDFERNQVRLYRHKTDVGYMIPIYPQLRPLLDKLRGETQPPLEEKIFKIASAKKSLAAACKRLELPNFSHRSFRRMFITRAIEKGVDVKVVSMWQGHRDGGKLILQTYSHVRQPHADQMALLIK